MKTALVTGASGFVGTYLTAALTATHNVVSFDRRHGGDIRDYEAVRSVIDRHNPDRIFHLAAQAYVPEAVTDTQRSIDVNVTGTYNVLEAVRQTGSHARVLIAGTSGEYGTNHTHIDESTPTTPFDPYGITKLAASQLGLAYWNIHRVPVVVTRAFNHTGPRQLARYAIPSFARRIAEFEAGQCDVVEHGNLEMRRNYTDVRDMVQAYILAIDLRPGEVYNINSTRTVSLSWVMHELIACARVSVSAMESDALYRAGSHHFPTSDCAKFQRATGWKPTITLEQTLEDTLDYWRTRV